MDLEKEIEKLKYRNQRVEADKSWEISKTRRALIMFFTYISVALYLNAINVQEPWLHAIVPSVGFMLSTLTLPYFKNLWLKTFYKTRDKN